MTRRGSSQPLVYATLVSLMLCTSFAKAQQQAFDVDLNLNERLDLLGANKNVEQSGGKLMSLPQAVARLARSVARLSEANNAANHNDADDDGDDDDEASRSGGQVLVQQQQQREFVPVGLRRSAYDFGPTSLQRARGNHQGGLLLRRPTRQQRLNASELVQVTDLLRDDSSAAKEALASAALTNRLLNADETGLAKSNKQSEFIYILSPISEQILPFQRERLAQGYKSLLPLSGSYKTGLQKWSSTAFPAVGRVQVSSEQLESGLDGDLLGCRSTKTLVELSASGIDEASGKILRKCFGAAELGACEGRCASSTTPSIKEPRGFAKVSCCQRRPSRSLRDRQRDESCFQSCFQNRRRRRAANLQIQIRDKQSGTQICDCIPS